MYNVLFHTDLSIPSLCAIVRALNFNFILSFVSRRSRANSFCSIRVNSIINTKLYIKLIKSKKNSKLVENSQIIPKVLVLSLCLLDTLTQSVSLEESSRNFVFISGRSVVNSRLLLLLLLLMLLLLLLLLLLIVIITIINLSSASAAVL